MGMLFGTKRLVATGFRQVYRVDYWETHAPLASLNSVRTFLSICCQYGYVIRQLDVETTFLNDKLDEQFTCANQKEPACRRT